MGYYNVISLLWIVLLFFYIKYVSKLDEETRNKFLKIQILLVLLYNIGQLIVFPWKFPIEFSTTSYFVVPIIVLFNIDKLKGWTVYASVFIGVIYFLGMIVAGNYMYSHFPVYSVLTSIFNHGSLLSYGIITLMTSSFDKSDRYIIWIGITLSAAWAYLLRPFVTFTGRVFIYEVLDGALIKSFLPNNLVFGYILYYLILIPSLVLSANFVHSLNRKLYKEELTYEKRTI